MAEFKERYERNRIFSREQQGEMASKKTAVIGCGGLGGYIVEMLTRAGVGHIVCCDGDVFSQSNLNRQLLCCEENLGCSKARAAAERIKSINSEIEVTVFDTYLSEHNAEEILAGCDAVVDGLDSVTGKLMLQSICKNLEIPMIHGAIDGWFGQVSTIFPGNDTLSLIYGDGAEVSQVQGNPSFTPAVVAGIQVGETLKVLLGYEDVLMRKVVFVDLMTNEFHKAEL